MTTKTETQPSQTIQFIDSIKDVTEDALKDVDTLSSFASSLTLVALDPSLNEGERLKLYKNDRGVIRMLAVPAMDMIKAEADGDPVLQNELEGNLFGVLDSWGIKKDTIPGFQKNETAYGQQAAELKEYYPEVDEVAQEQLTAIVERIKAQKDSWRDRDARDFAAGFLDIYYEAQMKLGKTKRTNSQETVNAIAACNMYSHSVAEALSGLMPQQRPNTENTLRSAIIRTLQERSTQDKVPSEDELQDSGPLREFTSAMRGARLETVSHSAIKEFARQYDITDVTFSSLVEDIKGGFDLVVTTSAGKKYLIDIKSRGSYEKLINESDKSIRSTTDRNAVLKKSKDTSVEAPIIVIDITAAGYDGRDTNKYVLSNPVSFMNTLRSGMESVDKSSN